MQGVLNHIQISGLGCKITDSIFPDSCIAGMNATLTETFQVYGDYMYQCYLLCWIIPLLVMSCIFIDILLLQTDHPHSSDFERCLYH